MEDVIAAAQRYPIPRGGLVTYEYVLLGGVNDTVPHARELARLLAGSALQGQPDPAQPGARDPVRRAHHRRGRHLLRVLADAGVTVSVRRPRGQDILAACGQLHLKKGRRSRARATPEALAPFRPAVRAAARPPGGCLLPPVPGLGRSPLERAEIYFLDAARAMVESATGSSRATKGNPFFDKPTLTYWLMAAAMELFGTTPAAARAVPVLSALGLVCATAWLGTLLFDRRSALAGGVVLATTLAFLSFARVAMSDMLLALLSTLAVSLAVLAYRPGAPRFAVPLLGAVAGLGFATKGPIAVLMPGIAVVLLLFQNRKLPVPGGVPGIAAGAVAFAGLGLGWFVLVHQRLGVDPLVYFFLRENLQRFAAETYDIGRPAWFYVPAYLAEGLPWSPFLPIALARLWGSADPQRRPSHASSRCGRSSCWFR